jgi:hypothetical protein
METMSVRVSRQLFIVSQIFAFFAFIFSIWAFQVKSKIWLLLLTAIFSSFLAGSATFLHNFTLAVLFGLAGIRNFVFCWYDWRQSKGFLVPMTTYYVWAIIFGVATVGSTIYMVHILQVRTVGWWVEWLSCITLIGLIIGNIQKGTNMMRLSYVANRFCNIVNHVYFANIIAVIIAISAIISNAVYYLRLLYEKMTRKDVKRQSKVLTFAGLLTLTIIFLIGFTWLFTLHFADLDTEGQYYEMAEDYQSEESYDTCCSYTYEHCSYDYDVPIY